jgi:hypothetical protein
MIFVLLGYYAVKQSKNTWNAGPLKMGQTDRPETSVTNYKSTPHKIKGERRIYEEGYISFGFISILLLEENGLSVLSAIKVCWLRVKGN